MDNQEPATEPVADEAIQAKASYDQSMRLYRKCWWLWVIGSMLIVFSWSKLVSYTVGWIGFGIALCATVVSIFAHRPFNRRNPFA